MNEEQIQKLIDDRIESRQLHSQYEAAYYSALVNVWVNTRFEFDRSLLTLSAGGIALVVTLMTTIGVPSATILIAQIAAASAFTVSVILLFLVFRGNADYVEKVIKKSPTSPSLKRLDGGALVFFIIGVLILFYIGFVSAETRLLSAKETEMSKTQTVSPTQAPSRPGQQGIKPERQKDSIEGIEELRPKPPPFVPSQPEPAKNPTTTGGAGKTDKK